MDSDYTVRFKCAGTAGLDGSFGVWAKPEGCGNKGYTFRAENLTTTPDARKSPRCPRCTGLVVEDRPVQS